MRFDPGYGAPAVAPVPTVDAGLNPIVGDPYGRTYVGGRSYYAQPYSFRQQAGTQWAQVGAFHPAWANPWDYSYGYSTPSTIWPVVGTTLPAAGLNPQTLMAQQGVSPGAAAGGTYLPNIGAIGVDATLGG